MKLTKLKNRFLLCSKIVKALSCLLIIALASYFIFKGQEPHAQNTGLTPCSQLASNIVAQPGINCKGSCKNLPQGMVPVEGINCLPSCANLADNITAQIGINCLYFGLDQCKTNNKYTAADHRVNCADIVDLPLCRDIVVGGGITAKPGKNCVNLCSDPAHNNPDPTNPNNERDINYAVSNTDCIRFCDVVGDEIQEINDSSIDGNQKPFTSKNCVTRKCHQLPSLIFPTPANNPTNCSILACNLLTTDELNKSKFDDDTKKYCEGSNLKCFDFEQEKLPFMRLREDNPTCIAHDCSPTIKSKDINDKCNGEVHKITEKGSGYTSVYERFINGGFDINTSAICRPVECPAVARRHYRCVAEDKTMTGDDDKDIYLNSECDLKDDDNKDQTCLNNYCYKKIDCSEAKNKNEYECATNIDDPEIFVADPFESWFYRPKPLSKAVDSKTGLLKQMQNQLCYSNQDMIDHGWSTYIWPLHWFYWWDDPRSPGPCSGTNTGNRGLEYGSLCGTSGNIYNKANEYSTYYRGYATTDFTKGYPRHKVTVCTRFNNTMDNRACGKRECSSTGVKKILTKNCGHDICRDLYIDEANETECMMRDGGDMNSSCERTVDNFIRLRAVKYGSRICSFLDSKGQVAYNHMFMDGTETLNSIDNLDDKIACVNDPLSSDGNCKGHDSNSNKSSASVWRALRQVHYVDNNRPSGRRGYIDKNGRFYPEQECPKVTLRIAPPDLYNLAIMSNSDKLFTPPLFIRSANIIKGGEESPADSASGANILSGEALYGQTDFHLPEIKVQFGLNTYSMSLEAGCTGYESTPTSTCNKVESTQIIETNFAGRQHKAEVFVRKEYQEQSRSPLFCLYHKFRDQHGQYLDPVRVGCVKRRAPDINNLFDRTINIALPTRQIFVQAKENNSYDNPFLVFRYVLGFGDNKKFDNCSSDDNCMPSLVLNNPDIETQSCTQEQENYVICVKREECSQLYNECVKNEINRQDAINKGEMISAFDEKRNYCNNTLLPKCNRKKGIENSGPKTIYEENFDLAEPNFYYGWFNEICINSGFQGKLKKVIAYKTDNGTLGKCVLDPTSPYLTDNNPLTKCDKGGKAPNCLCLEEKVAGTTYTDANYEIRSETTREAGLCVDIPRAGLCPAIDYTNNLDNLNDPDYLTHSLGKTEYNNINGVHISHQYRRDGKPIQNGQNTILAGHDNFHAEFPSAFIGTNQVRGECKGFWTYNTNSAEVAMIPTLSCINEDGKAKWGSDFSNPCIRYSCKEIKTSGPNMSGLYQGGYDINSSGSLETGENKGLSHGYAIWPKYTKINDFLETVSASSCIAGFKPKNGVLPTRSCDQTGNWYQPNNFCERITCAAIHPANEELPTSSTQMDKWATWFESGGARFAETPASRSTIRVQNESVAIGVCQESLGFFQSPGGLPPTRECDHLGNWGTVKNPCTTQCNAITSETEASNFNNGFAKWKKAAVAANGAGVAGEFDGCVAGYVTNPYAPRYDINENLLSNANDLTRAAETPKRLCKTGNMAGNVSSSVWGVAVNGCINQCPGADTDPRIGVGRTTHLTSSGQVVIDWPSTPLGQEAYISNWGEKETNLNASYFRQGRTNKYYLLRRRCGLDGRWELGSEDVADPQKKYNYASPMCSANAGVLDNASYLVPTVVPGYKNSIATDNSIISGICKPRYWKYNNNTAAAPARKCLFESSNQYIDKVYLDLVAGSNDCELVSCPAVSNQRGALSKFNSSVRIKIEGAPNYGQLQGTCLNNEKNSSNQTIFTSLAQGLVPPTLVCQEDGTWSQPKNEGNCKHGCDFAAHANVRLDISGSSGDGNYFKFYDHSLQHGQSVTFTAYECKSGQCVSWAYGEYCNNGERLTTDNSLSNSMTNITSTKFTDWWRTNAYSATSGGARRGVYDPFKNQMTSYISTAQSGYGVFLGPNGIQKANKVAYLVDGGYTYIDKRGAVVTFGVECME